MPAKDHDEEIEKAYKISDIHQQGRHTIVMGDFNSIVGEGSTNKNVGLLEFMREIRCSSTSAGNVIRY